MRFRDWSCSPAEHVSQKKESSRSPSSSKQIGPLFTCGNSLIPQIQLFIVLQLFDNKVNLRVERSVMRSFIFSCKKAKKSFRFVESKPGMQFDALLKLFSLSLSYTSCSVGSS